MPCGGLLDEQAGDLCRFRRGDLCTLIWLYLNWIVLLFGAQLAYYIQNPAFLRIGRREPRLSNAMRERLALNVMLFVGRAFRDPDVSITAHQISEKMRIPSITLAPVVEALEAGGLLAATDKEDLLPGKDMATIRLKDILVGRSRYTVKPVRIGIRSGPDEIESPLARTSMMPRY